MFQKIGLGRKRTRRTRIGSRWPVAVLERLETRIVPAGVANVTFAAGTLTITGVDDLTPAGITGGLNNQNVLLVGGAVGAVTVSGQAGTTLTGAAGPFTGVTAIKLDMKLGNDAAQLQAVNITGALTSLGGDGNNSLVLENGTQSFGSITVTNGDGDDSFLTNGLVTVTGAVTLNHGDGSDSNILGNTSTANASFGSLKITSGDGFSTVAVGGASLNVAGTTQITTGDGGTQVILTPTALTLGGALTMTNGSDFNEAEIGKVGGTTNTKAVTITNGSGDSHTTLRGTYVGAVSLTNADGFDFLNLQSFAVTGNVTIKNGAGGSASDFDGVVGVTGALSLTNGAGDDTVGTNSTNVTSLTVTGTSTIANGEGASTIVLSPTLAGTIPAPLILGGALTITNGNGFNAVTIGSLASTTNVAAVSITSVSGGSRTGLIGPHFGAVNITNADGNDELFLDSISVTGNVTIKNGAGGSKTDFFGAVGVTGALSLTNGAGDDTVGTNSTGWASLNVTGAMTIANGNGAADVRLSPITGASTVSVGGALSLTNGIGNTTWKLQAKTSTTVTGATTITCGEGNDTLVLGATTPSNDSYQAMTINFGGGNSTVNFNGNETLNGNLTLNAGPGFHLVNINKPLATKNATLNLQGVGFGSGFVTVITLFQSWTVTGNLSITTNRGNDLFSVFAPLVVTGTTTVSTGLGNDSIYFGNAGLALTGNISISTGAGQDSVTFSNGGTVTGNLTVNTGTQDDRVDINHETFQGTVSLTLGGGADLVTIQQNNDASKSRFEKAVTINNDAGDDLVNIGLANDVNDFAEFLAALTINGGAGLDTVRFKNAAQGGTRSNTFAFVPTIATFELQE